MQFHLHDKKKHKANESNVMAICLVGVIENVSSSWFLVSVALITCSDELSKEGGNQSKRILKGRQVLCAQLRTIK